MKYSVIIPVYNAEKTLRRCVDSILDQNCADAEIILVNDGSRDGSGTICEEYAREHQNVRYISKENGGVSSARNAGLDAAKGEYVLFVDSDDYVTSNFFPSIEEAANGNCTDLIQFSNSTDNGTEIRKDMRRSFAVCSRKELIPHIVDAICRKTINAPWANLYRRKIIEEHHIRFPEGASVGEDRVFNIVYSLFIQSYASSETVVYILNTENENSLSRKRHDDLQKQFNIAGKYLENELSAAQIPADEKACYRRAVDFGKCRSIYHDAKLMIIDGVGWMERQKRLLKLCKRINGKHMKYPSTRYCYLITLPVRLYLAPVIDFMAKKLVHRGNK